MTNLRFSEDDLTFGDLEDIEEYSGEPFTGLRPGPDGKVELSSKMIVALVWVSQRHDNPDFTIEDARKVKISAIDVGEPDPTSAAGESGSTR